MIQKKPRTTYRRTYRRPVSNRAYVARIARSVVRRAEETKCFSQLLVTAGNVSTSWQYFSALAGLTQGTGTFQRVGSKISIMAIEMFIQIVPSSTNVPANGASCRFAIYHNKAAGGALPATNELWDSNGLVTGRFVNYARKYSILEDITHQMVITARDSTGTYAVGPKLVKMLRVTPRTTVEFGLNGGTISDLPLDDFGMATIADGANCCQITVYSKVWFKDA